VKITNLYDAAGFGDVSHKSLLVHDSPYFKILNFNFRPGQGLPVHSHDLEGQVSIVVLQGEGEFRARDDARQPARAGDVLVCDIAEPHGIIASTPMRVLVTIAPPI
jgi:quercetin dioxygenase-like cupin family protein